MSQQQSASHTSPTGSAGAPKGRAAETEAAVRHLISCGEHRAALDRAKEFHKTVRTPESEALLVDAYVERIRALKRQGLVVEANALVQLVRQRHPSSRKRLDELAKPAAASRRALDELVRPLADPALPIDDRTSIERSLQRDVWDLAALAGCEALPAGHSLRTAAAALDRAFAAVTSGPVSDEALDLPEVARRSPLAPWKLLVRAIAYFHRGERESCERYLHAIDPESVPARLVPALRAMLGGDAAGPLSPAALALRAAIARKPALLRGLEALDRAFASRSRSGILKSIRAACEECRASSSGQLEALEQQIFVRGAAADLEPQRVIAAMGDPIRRDATFYRLFARAMEETRDPERLVLSCAMWDEFRRAAAREGWFAENGPESAAISLHMAALLEQLPDSLLREVQQAARRDAEAIGMKLSALSPDELYQRACVLDPHPEAFSRWLAWTARQPGGRADRVASAWHKIRPQDVEPIRHLMEEAETRRAFGTALGYLAKLERIDSLHHDVQHRRLRLLAGGAIEQLRSKKPGAAADMVEQLAGLPQAQQGDRPAVVAALRAAVSALRRDADATAACAVEVERLLQGRAAAALLLSSVGMAAKQRALARLGPVKDLSTAERASLPRALSRLGILCGELRIGLALPQPWLVEAVRQFSASRKALELNELRALAELALDVDHAHLAYAVTAEGLARGGSSEAGFLYLRARALARSPERSVVCAMAAAALARQQQDPELVEKALALARAPWGMEPFSLTLDQARDVLRQEMAASERPGRRGPEPDYRHLLPQCQCADCRRSRGEPVDPFDDFGDEDDDEDDDGLDLPGDIPPDIAEALLDAMAEASRQGESFDSFASRVLGTRSPGRRRRTRKTRRKR